MSTVKLDHQELLELQPAHALWRLYAPERAPYRFHAKSRATAETWQQTTRAALMEILGFAGQVDVLPAAPLSPRWLESVDKGDYIREKWLLRTSAYTLMPVYILIPKQGTAPHPVVVAFHGHGYGVKDIVGLWEDGTER
ncbi:MAG TPA: alpha/beta hydrolase family protein, partial [Anaerolineae bacterium]|nr:alpha/beta hydrolase family protein [Anaerolineae bacterium]HQI87543.1 alpha/beta hydrolase family protein [Anaerolineae bacterium]